MLLQLKEIKKTYKPAKDVSVPALRGVDLTIKKGDFTAIIGPSGSGKSTLFNIIGCLDKPTSGSIMFREKDITNLKEGSLVKIRRQNIGYIFQSFNLVPTLTAYENAEYPFWNQPGVSRKERKSRVLELFEQLDIISLKNRYPKHLSGGQQQRVAIARALVLKPSLVLADEPTANLDSTTSQLMIDLMQKEAKITGTTFIFATHDLELLKHISDIVYLKDGQIIKREVHNV
jgi:putative ABC transport system ATP-binding protein